MTKSRAKWIYMIHAEPKSWRIEEETVHGSINHKGEVERRRKERGSKVFGFSRIIRERVEDRTAQIETVVIN